MYIVKFSGILMCILYSIVAFDCCLNLGELLDLHSCVIYISQSLLVIMHNSGTIVSRTVVGCQVNRQL